MRRVIFCATLMIGGACWGQQQEPAKPCQDAAGKPVACDSAKPKTDTGQPMTPRDAKQAFPFPEDDSKKAAEEKPVPDAPAASDVPSKSDQKPVTPKDAQKSFPFPGEDKTDAKDASGSSSSSSSSSGDSSSKSPDADNPEDDAGPATPAGVKLKDLGSRGDMTKKMSPDQRFDEDLKVADFYRNDGNFNGAYARYKDALEQYADDPEAHLGAGDMALKLGHKDEAKQHYEAVLKADAEPKVKKAAEKALADLK